MIAAGRASSDRTATSDRRPGGGLVFWGGGAAATTQPNKARLLVTIPCSLKPLASAFEMADEGQTGYAGF